MPASEYQAALAAGNVAALSVFAFLLNAGLHLVLLFAGRRRDQQFGIAFDSRTHWPVGLATVRASDPHTGRVVQTAVTDARGRYAMSLPDGTYHIDVRMAGYSFPPLFGISPDPQYRDVLTEAMVNVAKGETLAADIPLDPSAPTVPPVRVLFLRYTRFGQRGLAVAAALLAVAAAVLSTTVPLLLLVAVQVASYALFSWLMRVPKPRSFGVVRDEAGQPLPQAVVRLFETRFHKLLESQVTDARGHFGFLVRKGEYEITVEAKGYEPWKGAAKLNADGSRVINEVTLKTKAAA